MKRVLRFTLAAWLLAAPCFLLAQSGQELYAEANANDRADDKQLNAAYDQLLKDIRTNHPDQADLLTGRLRESQRAWLKYRDAQVVFVGTYNEIGSASARAAGMSSYSHDLTQARIKDFQNVPDPF